MNLRNRKYLEVVAVRDNGEKHRENIDKIKFPFHCYYSKDLKHKRLGLVSENSGVYYLADLAVQKKKRSDVDTDMSLENLIIDNNIMIVKVKLIIFE